MTAFLALKHISKRFGGVVALDNVEFDLQAGEIHGLIGENGAGKSTVMKILAGVHAEFDGEMLLDGKAVRFTSPADAQAKGIGMVYQELSAFGSLTVAENIFGRHVPTRFGLVDWKRMNREAQQHLHELGLDIDVTHSMGSLPVGNQQLVEIARVVFSGAKSIILDEPTSALSPPETRRLFELMARLKAQGRTMVFISHFLDDVLEVTDRITVFKNGKKVTTLHSKESSKQQLVELMIGGDAESLKALYQDSAVAAAQNGGSEKPEMLRTESLSKAGAFAEVSMTLRQGEILGLFAFMGGGQIQLARCLFGAEPVDGGRIMLGGKPVKLSNTTRARDAGIAFVPEDRRYSVMHQKEIFKNITLAHLGKLVPMWFRESQEQGIAKDQIKNVGVRPALPRLHVGGLSGGNQQKVVLAKWLTETPRVLILSEPTRGMDVGAKEEVVTIVKRLREQGVAILLVTTEPEAILSIADRALVMRKGRVTAELSGSALTKEALMSNA